MKILILGGIKEAAELAGKLVDEGHGVTTSLAGRTKEPKPVAGAVRTGGFGGATGLAAYLTEHQIDLLIDCTHPFANQISANAIEAAKLTNVKLKIHTRPPWQKEKGDQWIDAASLEDMRDKIPENTSSSSKRAVMFSFSSAWSTDPIRHCHFRTMNWSLASRPPTGGKRLNF